MDNTTVYDIHFYDEDGKHFQTKYISAVNDRVACAVVLNEMMFEVNCSGWRMWNNGREVKPETGDYR